MKKKLLIAFMILTMVVTLFVGCSNNGSNGDADNEGSDNGSGDDKIVIGLTLMDYNFTFFQDMLAMAKKTAEENGVELVHFDGRGDTNKQLGDVEDMIAALGIDALFLNPVDTEAIVPAVLSANDANVPVVTVDVKAAGGNVMAHISSDNVEIGRTAARYAVELIKEKNGEEKGSVIMIGYPQITSIRDRMQGFEEVIASYPNITLEKRDPITLNVEAALSLTEDVLQANPAGSVDIIFGANSTNALGVLSAVESAARNELSIIGVDEDTDLMAALQRQSPFAATVVQYPTEMGRLGVEYAIKLAKGEKITETQISTQIDLVTRDTIAEFMVTKERINEEIKDYR